MSPYYRSSLVGAGRVHVGAAHFLFADKSEPRIAPLLRMARASADDGPVVILVSMTGEFAPRKVLGSEITADAIGAMLVEAAAPGTLKGEL